IPAKTQVWNKIMSITEAERHQLYQRLENVLGSDEAAILMEHLPPVGWADVATRSSIEQSLALLSAEVAASFAAAHSDMQRMEISIRSDMERMGAGIRGDMERMGAGLRGDMESGHAGL